LDKFSTAPALMLVVMMEAIAASWVRKVVLFFFLREKIFVLKGLWY
jgi:hypothetical protein